MAPELNQEYRIKSIDKAIFILELMALEGRDLTLNERILLPPSGSPAHDSHDSRKERESIQSFYWKPQKRYLKNFRKGPPPSPRPLPCIRERGEGLGE